MKPPEAEIKVFLLPYSQCGSLPVRKALDADFRLKNQFIPFRWTAHQILLTLLAAVESEIMGGVNNFLCLN